jgi:hypothetical protein
MVSSMNTLDYWNFKEKEWILLLCVACALVYWLKTCSVSLGFLVWFFVENYDYGLASSKFWCMGFTTSIGVTFCHSFSSRWLICFVPPGCNAIC